jgi:hypothetical protein
VERERTEISLERDGFEAFADRVDDIPQASPRDPALPACTRTVAKPAADETNALRQAYADTVMAVPHYDEIYGESVREHASAELGPELAGLLNSSRPVPLPKTHKEALVAAAERQAAERDEFCSTLDGEMDSLRSRRHELTTVLNELETSVVPSEHRQRFEDRLTRTLRARQSTLGSQPSLSHIDGHNLCSYLYEDEPWTYPVLTAVARLLDSVTMRE